MTQQQRELIRSVDRWALGAVHLPIAPLVAEKIQRDWRCITKGHDWQRMACRRCGEEMQISDVWEIAHNTYVPIEEGDIADD